MKVLVTGATGFIGREIVNELCAANQYVFALGRSENRFKDFPPNVGFYIGDVSDIGNLAELRKLKNLDGIVHSAGLAHQFGDTRKSEFDAVNVKGTENLANLGVELGIRHFILISSTAIYETVERAAYPGEPPVPTDENARLAPPTLYAASKLESELVCRRICEAAAIPLTILRPAPVIGENNVGNVARLIEAIDKNRFIWIGDGQNYKSLIYKKDVARACVRLLETKKNGTEIFNLAAPPLKMKDFVGIIADRLGRKVPGLKIPAILPRAIFEINDKIFNFGRVKKLSATVEKWLADDIYAAEKIASEYNFAPQTSIAEAIQRQIAFYQSNKNRKGNP